MPAEFYAQPADSIGDESLQLIYSEVVDRLQKENPHADTLECMMLERVAFLYVHIRHKETQKSFAHDRAYKETLQLWVQMAASLQKKREANLNLDDIKDKIVNSVQIAVMDAAKGTLPPEVAKNFQEKLLVELDAAGI